MNSREEILSRSASLSGVESDDCSGVSLTAGSGDGEGRFVADQGRELAPNPTPQHLMKGAIP